MRLSKKLKVVLLAASLLGSVAQAVHGQAVYYGGRYSSQTRLTAAHRTLPFGTWVRVTDLRTGRAVNVMVNDRGPFGNPRRIIDLSYTAARQLGIVSRGVAEVDVQVIGRRR